MCAASSDGVLTRAARLRRMRHAPDCATTASAWQFMVDMIPEARTVEVAAT